MDTDIQKQLTSVICDIKSLHEMVSRDFEFKDTVPNLASKQVKDYVFRELKTLDSGFLILIKQYLGLASNTIINNDMEFRYSDLEIRSRVKQYESIVNKLLYYTVDLEQQGSVSVNKCLNDLLGFRIHLPGFDHANNNIVEICKELHSSYSYKIVGRNSSKEDYRATHVYFYGNNRFFPWELQIWNSSDSQTNEESHKMHKSKRAYIDWPQLYIKSIKEGKEGE